MIDGYEDETATLRRHLREMTEYRDNALYVLKFTECQRDEARVERDALFRALVRRMGREYATTLMRRARRRFEKKQTAAQIGGTDDNG